MIGESVYSVGDPDALVARSNVERFQPRQHGSAASSPFKVFGLHEFTQLALPVRQHVLAPILPEKGLAMLYAQRGVGKTHVALGIAYAVASGGQFLRWQASQPRNVLYVDGEMPGRLLQERLDAIIAGAERLPPEMDGSFRLLAMDTQDIGLSLNLADPADQKKLDNILGTTNFLVLDNLSTLVHGGRENDAESWDAMQAWLLQLRRRGISVLLVHHAGRGDNARGTSKREDVLDTVIRLKHPEDYQTEEGARFEVHLTKARGVHGDDASPFEARLTMNGDASVWSVQDLKDVEADQVAELSEAGSSAREIADELGMSKSKANRIQKRLKAEGRL